MRFGKSYLVLLSAVVEHDHNILVAGGVKMLLKTQATTFTRIIH